ncbi:TIGR02453 family protein [Alisedimentitalea sp. MJ-SS2]|uniref:TIGR02453 family protein n=1 Tax=Aliisedimentitalea sp. MJ-SS2 TaxID=3049795 RepID=UPI0029134C2D|nr:TIGR02453 family protein [Alisedimentitalea sp. MJ-SS2]MDU8926327.1 TIGR02453 family protein [Alisedimentitalea sp. MJ-SS2]
MSFDRLIPDTLDFLRALSGNNTRDWFNANKTTYDSQLKAPALLLLEDMAARLTRLTGQRTITKLFRPHRDVRFSKDKTPYHTHLHLLWTSADGGQWFFGISPDYVTAGAGRMGFDKKALAAYRANLPGQGAALLSAVTALLTQGARLSDPELKRPAAPITPDDPLADLARRKSLAVWFDYETPPLGLPGRLEQDFTRLWPLQQALSSALGT